MCTMFLVGNKDIMHSSKYCTIFLTSILGYTVNVAISIQIHVCVAFDQ